MSNNSGAGALKPPIITLRELTVLVSNCPLLHLITAPKLLYLDVYIEYPTQSRIEDTYDHLCGFNFSTITQIRTAVKPSCSYFVTGRRNSACSEWEDLIEFDWRLPLDMYRYTSGPSPRWIFDEVPASGYPNQFHISFGSGWKWDRQPASILSSTFSLYIEKAANLVEIVLEELDLTPPFTGRARINSFTNALRKATTVRYLTVLSSQSFEDFCEFFADSTLIPNLQRLSYTPAGPNYEGKSGPARIYFSLRDLANGRLGLATYLRQPRSLEIELKNVPYIPPWEVKEIESLGSRLKWEGGGNRVNLFMTLTDGPDFKKMIEDTFSRAHEPST